MILKSAFPVRLLLRCPTCHGRAAVYREHWIAGQTFCPRDGVPMTVIGAAAGCEQPTPDWPDVDFPAPVTNLRFDLATAV